MGLSIYFTVGLPTIILSLVMKKNLNDPHKPEYLDTVISKPG